MCFDGNIASDAEQERDVCMVHVISDAIKCAHLLGPVQWVRVGRGLVWGV